MDSSTVDVLLPLMAAGAAASVASLAILQTDRASRWMLSSPRLMAKRRQEYSYHWKAAVERAHLQLDYYLAGGSDKFNADPEINLKNTNYLDTVKEQNSLVIRIVSEKESKFSVLKIDRDPSDPTGNFFLFLRREQEGCNSEYFQVPLTAFCQQLREAFENQLTTTTLCFVADASAGQASGLLEELVQEAKTGVAVMSEPLWMVNLARLAEARIYSESKLRTILFALCRLDAWALRDQAKISHTVMITLPGQSVVAALLALVQAVFPEDRHIFAYDGCVASVERSLRLHATFRRSTVYRELDSIIGKLAQNPVRHSTPLPTNTPLSKSLLTLETALAKVPIKQAQAVESWMSSVDAFIRLKDQTTKNGYLPYVFKLSFLTKPVGGFAPSTESYWSLSSLLQFVTGSRSRDVPDGVMDAAREFLKDYNRDNQELQRCISEANNKAIENCVFQHKSILIGNKTLKDTVLPSKHWTLKQASRAGCSCCGPDPYEQDEDEQMDDGFVGAFSTILNQENSSTTAVPVRARQSTAYVDGKMSFAFDPAKFS